MPKNWRKKKILSKSVSGYHKTKKKEEKNCHGLLSHWCREGKTLVVRPLKKKTFFPFAFPKAHTIFLPFSKSVEPNKNIFNVSFLYLNITIIMTVTKKKSKCKMLKDSDECKYFCLATLSWNTTDREKSARL